MLSREQKISVLIVNYKSQVNLRRLVNSLDKIKPIILEIIIVNNDNEKLRQKQLKKYSPLRIINNYNNLGFSKAVNKGINVSHSNYILLLNPDTTIIDTSILRMHSHFIKNNKIGVIGGKIYNGSPNKLTIGYTATDRPTFQISLFEFTILKKIFPKIPLSRNFWIEKKITNINKATEVSSLCGAFMMFRKKINDQIFRFNEDYFLYFEDIDFCLEYKNRDFSVQFYPKAKIYHYGGGSSKSIYRTSLKDWYTSRKIFFKKHFSPPLYYFSCVIFYIEGLILSLYHTIKNEPNT